jgi:integrase
MDNTTLTLGAFMTDWLEDTIKPTTRYGTHRAYGGYINNHINKMLGCRPLAELNPQLIQRFVHDLAEIKKLSPRTIHIIMRLLSCALGFAEDCGYVDRSPYRRIKLPKIVEDEVEAFSNEEQTLIERTALSAKDPRTKGFLIMLYTGLRLGELCALKWENVDLGQKCLWVKTSMTRAANPTGKTKTRLEATEPKTKKSKRMIHLPDFLCDVLKTHKAQSNSVYVISEPSGKFVDPRILQKLFKRLLNKLNIPPRTLHALRHTFCVRALETGADIKSISMTLGHTDVMITLNRYAHSLTEQRQRMMNNLDLYFKNKGIGLFFQT